MDEGDFKMNAFFKTCACLAGTLAAVLAATDGRAAGLAAADANHRLLSAAYDPARAAYPPLSDQGVALRVIRGKEWPLHLGISRAGAPEKIVELPRAMEQVAQLRVHGNRVAVQAWLGPDEQGEIAIFDLQTGQLVDDFLEYRAVFSPDGRQIAFVKFYPAHFLQSYEDQAMLYDLEASPAQNRPAYGAVVPSPDKRSMQHHAGMPLHPLAAGELGRQNANLVDQDEYHRKVSEFAWSADSRRVAFVDARKGAASLVVVDTRSLQQQARVASFDAGLVDASAAALPELADVCSVQGDAPARTCVDLDYAATRLELGDAAATVSLSAGDQPAATRTVRVDSQRLKPVPR